MEVKETRNLSHPILGVREFPLEQADNIMKMSNNGGWEELSDTKEKSDEVETINPPEDQGQQKSKKNANTSGTVTGGTKKAKTRAEK